MQKTTELMPGCKFRVTYTFDYSEALPEAMKVAGKVRIPGFRRGHVPFSMVVRAYGAEPLFEEAFENLVSFQDMVKDLEEAGHSSTFMPMVKVVSAKKDEPVVYELTWSIEPQITIGEYKGTKVIVPEQKVTDEMINSEIHNELSKQTSYTNITDRPCEVGDSVTIDFEGTIDGKAFEGGSGLNTNFRIGEGRFLPDFENGIVGMNVGEEKDCKVLFPENYSKDLGGKEAVFHITLNAIVKETLPELDDEFVQDVSEFDTVEEYREDIRKKLEKKVAEHNKDEVTNRIIAHLVDLSDIQISEELIAVQTKSNRDRTARMYAQQGMDYDKMLEEAGLGSKFADMMAREEAVKGLKDYYLCRKLMELKGIAATDEEVDAFLEESREELGSRYDEYVAHLTAEMKDSIRNEVEIRKLTDALSEELEISFVEPGDPALTAAASVDAETKAAEADTEAPSEDGKE